ncbi:MAG: hypothetical protein HY897_23245 [Deltaproteobacteria bacterium]|nr:hypothetical protein [Deltaproteobacteria bacterium]
MPVRWDVQVEKALRVHLENKKVRRVKVSVPAWDMLAVGEAHAVAARRIVGIWQRMSRLLVGCGIREVEVVCPADRRFLMLPGAFGAPSRYGDAGDDHWRVARSPQVLKDDGVEALCWRLYRKGNQEEDRKRETFRRTGNHVVAFARASKAQYRCSVTGVIGENGHRVPLPIVHGPLRPNPTSAVAEGLAAAFGRFPAGPDLTVWTNDDLVRAAARGNYLDKNRTGYRGVRPPEMDSAIQKMLKAIRRRSGGVKFKHAKKGGVVMMEIVAARFGLSIPDEIGDLLRAIDAAIDSPEDIG